MNAIARNFINLTGILKHVSLKSIDFKRPLTSSPKLCSLQEFFDDEKHWGLNEVKSGRSWTKDDLRIKSNDDLHKLWYVLLKERNMLLTMEYEAIRQTKLFPSPERLDKVQDSMKNLEEVVRERNRAYHLLETGETGERPVGEEINVFGIKTKRKLVEYPIPKFMNTKWKKEHPEFELNDDVKEFQLKRGEQNFMAKKRQKTRNFNHVIGLLNRFPNMDMEALKQQYPDVDIEKAKRSRKYKGMDN